MSSNSDEILLGFLKHLIESRIDDKKHLRLQRGEVVSAVSEYFAVRGQHEDPLETFESWEPILKESLFIADYSVKYSPFTETLAIQWVPAWKNIEWAAEIRNQTLRSEMRESIVSLSAEEFEILLQQVFSRVPWAKGVRMTGRTGDGGIDFAGTFVEPQSRLEFSLFGQAKHWGSKVGSDAIRTFIGSVTIMAKGRAAIGIFISSGGFTSDAEQAVRSSPIKVQLFDLDHLIDLMVQNKIGVVDVTVRGQQIDGSFWDEFRI